MTETLGFFQVRIASLHIVERGVKPRVNGQIELVGGVIGNGDARGRSLGVVHQHVNAAELLDCGIDNALHHGLIVGAGIYVGLDGEDLDAVLALQLFFRRFQLGYVASGNDKVCAFLGVGDGNAVADGARFAVFQLGHAGAGDNGSFAFKKIPWILLWYEWANVQILSL